MYDHTDRNGNTLHYMTSDEIRGLSGYHDTQGGAVGRARCPFHNGENRDALMINWGTGWGKCWRCHERLRVQDHAETHLPRGHPDYQGGGFPAASRAPVTLDSLRASRSQPQPRREPPGSRRDPVADPVDRGQLRAALRSRITADADALPGSPGAAYLAGRGIDAETARALALGWEACGPLAHRVVFPLADPAGQYTGAIARALSADMNPKYKALETRAGYEKTLFNGAAISQAAASGGRLLIVEGPIDAAAAYAAGYPLTVALGSTSYAHWEHFRGVQRALLFLDNDQAGKDATGRAYGELAFYIPDLLALRSDVQAGILEGVKDLGEYWQRFRRMPALLGALLMGPFPVAAPAPLLPDLSPDNERLLELADQLGPQLAADPDTPGTLPPFDSLPADLQEEARELAGQLAADPDALAEFEADYRANAAYLTAADFVAARAAIDLARGMRGGRVGQGH